jgi:hypothetical protein
MIIVEGTPGAGKTTYLGRVLADGCQAGRPPVIWPEAQLSRDHSTAGFSTAATLSLLQESVARLRLASRYDAEIYSDRSYLTVLALRYALERYRVVSAGTYLESVSMCSSLRLPELYFDTELILFRVTPDESVQRRMSGAVTLGDGMWWDHAILAAMNEWYDENLDRYFHGRVIDRPMADASPVEREEDSTWAGSLVDGRTCTCCSSEARSGTCVWRGRELTLFSRGLHVRDDDGPRCYHDSAEILAWHRRRRDGQAPTPDIDVRLFNG